MEESLVLEELIAIHGPSLLPLLQVIKNQIDSVVQCPREWSKFIAALSSTSPVCGLLHPSDRLFNILNTITDDDFTANPSNLEILQEEVPVLFELLRDVSHLPKKAMKSLINALIDKANAPFKCMEGECALAAVEDQSQELSYFPNLPLIQPRGIYEADKHVRKATGCTKHSSGHPSLLPGIFTLFCPHGE